MTSMIMGPTMTMRTTIMAMMMNTITTMITGIMMPTPGDHVVS